MSVFTLFTLDTLNTLFTLSTLSTVSYCEGCGCTICECDCVCVNKSFCSCLFDRGNTVTCFTLKTLRGLCCIYTVNIPVTILNCDYRTMSVFTLFTLDTLNTLSTIGYCECCCCSICVCDCICVNKSFCSCLFNTKNTNSVFSVRTACSTWTSNKSKIFPSCAIVIRNKKMSVFKLQKRCLSVFTISTFCLNACIDAVNPPITILNIRNSCFFHYTEDYITVFISTTENLKSISSPFRNVNCKLTTADFKSCFSVLIGLIYVNVTLNITACDMTCTAYDTFIAWKIIVPIVNLNCTVIFSCTCIYDCSAFKVKSTVNTNCNLLIGCDCSLTLDCKCLINAYEQERITSIIIISLCRSNIMTVKIKCNITRNLTVIYDRSCLSIFLCSNIEIFWYLNVSNKLDCIATYCCIKCFLKCFILSVAYLRCCNLYRNNFLRNKYLTTYWAMLTFCKSCFFKCGSHSCVNHFCMTKCINHCLCNEYFVTYWTMLTFCKTCIFTIRSNRVINYFCVSKCFTLRNITYRTCLRYFTSSIYPSVTESFAICFAAFTLSGFCTCCIRPYVCMRGFKISVESCTFTNCYIRWSIFRKIYVFVECTTGNSYKRIFTPSTTLSCAIKCGSNVFKFSCTVYPSRCCCLDFATRDCQITVPYSSARILHPDCWVTLDNTTIDCYAILICCTVTEHTNSWCIVVIEMTTVDNKDCITCCAIVIDGVFCVLTKICDCNISAIYCKCTCVRDRVVTLTVARISRACVVIVDHTCANSIINCKITFIGDHCFSHNRAVIGKCEAVKVEN